MMYYHEGSGMDDTTSARRITASLARLDKTNTPPWTDATADSERTGHMIGDSPAFRAHILGWLRQNGTDAASVEAIHSYGTDWAGDTDHGFHAGFTVEIRYTDSKGRPGIRDVDGEDMQSLWQWVVGVWPEPAHPEAFPASSEETAR